MKTPNKFYYGYWIVFASFVTLSLSSGLVWYGFSVLNKPIADEFGWGRGQVTAGFFAFVLGIACFSPFVGRLVDKSGPRRILLLGAILVSLPLMLLSKTSSLWSFYLLYLGLGIAYTFLGAVPASIMVSNWFYRLRGTMQGLAFTGIGFGGLALAPLFGNYIIPHFGWQSAYLVMAFLLLVTILPLAWFIVRDHPQEKGLRPHGQEGDEVTDSNDSHIAAASGLTVVEALRTPAFWIIVLTGAVYAIGLNACVVNQVSIFTEQGFSAASAVAAIGLVGLFSGIGKFLFGYICDHIEPKYATAISYGLIALSIVIMIQARSMTHLWLYAAFNGIGQGGWAPNLAMLAVTYFGLKHYGAVLGAIHLCFYLGAASGPMIAGFTFDWVGSYRLVLLIIAALCFVIVPIMAFMKKAPFASYGK